MDLWELNEHSRLILLSEGVKTNVKALLSSLRQIFGVHNNSVEKQIFCI